MTREEGKKRKWVEEEEMGMDREGVRGKGEKRERWEVGGGRVQREESRL